MTGRTAAHTATPANHPYRFALNRELHARPAEDIEVPARASYLALSTDDSHRQEEYESLLDLSRRFGVEPPAPDLTRCQWDLGPFRLRWERRSECTSYTFVRPGESGEPFQHPALESVPADWLRQLPGNVLVAAHVAMRRSDMAQSDDDEIAALFGGHPVSGSRIADGAARVIADFRIHPDGFTRYLIDDTGLAPRQAGRTAQRLLEIETYVMRASLSFPVARDALPVLMSASQQLAALVGQLATAGHAERQALLTRLTRLAGTVESTLVSTHYRLGAAHAYRALVESRVAELRELPLDGLPTLREFLEQRLVSGTNTCEAVGRLQENLSARIGRAAELIRAHAGARNVARDEARDEATEAAAVLPARETRRHQRAVELLSVSAASYFAVGMFAHLVRALQAGGSAIDPEIAIGVSVPVVAVLAVWGLRRARHATSGTRI